jgi:hypothetical protein
MSNTELIIRQTKKWISDIVIGCNFCPFAAREVRRNSVHYEIENSAESKDCLDTFLRECERLDKNPGVETILVILPNAVPVFEDYLLLVSKAEALLKKKGYEGVYQVASFHPHYCFAAAPTDDAANYTNRSIYPMLHLLREESIEAALKKYINPEQIPQQNIQFAREKGAAYMQMLRDACL